MALSLSWPNIWEGVEREGGESSSAILEGKDESGILVEALIHISMEKRGAKVEFAYLTVFPGNNSA